MSYVNADNLFKNSFCIIATIKNSTFLGNKRILNKVQNDFLYPMVFLKNFFNWFQLKPKLDEHKQRPLFQEREVWMCHLGSNIGFELDGKKSEQLRPVIIFKKLSKETFLAIPISSGVRKGSWYSSSFVQKRVGRFCLNQIRMLDSKRLKYWIERIDDEDFKKLQLDFYNFLRS